MASYRASISQSDEKDNENYDFEDYENHEYRLFERDDRNKISFKQEDMKTSVFSPLKSRNFSPDRSSASFVTLPRTPDQYKNGTFNFKKTPDPEVYEYKQLPSNLKQSVGNPDKKPLNLNSSIYQNRNRDVKTDSRNSFVPQMNFERDMSTYHVTPERDQIFKNRNTTSSNHHIMRKEKEPQTFDGKNSDWQDYIVHFEQVADWNEWTDQDKAKQVVMSLRGPAQKILSNLSKQELGCYEKIKFTLNQRFNPRERDVAYRCEFRTRKQKLDETVSDYGHALRRLGCLAFPKNDLETLENFLIDRFVSGLKGHDLQKHVQFQHPQTLDSAISHAIEYEAFENPQNHFKKPTESQEEIISVKAIAKSSANAEQKEEKITLDQIAKLIDKKLSQLNNSNVNRQNYLGNRNFRNNRFKSFQNRANIICYWCGQKGHIQYDCPENNTQNQGNE